MNDQNVMNKAPAKKMSPSMLLSVISLALAIVGGLVFGFVYFIWPNIVGVAALIVWPAFILMYVPVLNLIPLVLIGIADFAVAWAGWLAIASVVAALGLSMVNIFMISKEKPRGLVLASTVVSGAVLLSIVLVTLVNTILTVLGLSVTFGVVGVLYLLMFLSLI